MTTDFHCYDCGDPITGGVSQTTCIDCLIGIDRDEWCCQSCDEPCELGEDFCDSCQAELDEYDEGVDQNATKVITDDFDAMLNFLHGREEDA